VPLIGAKSFLELAILAGIAAGLIANCSGNTAASVGVTKQSKS
jgi:hypothetical protein